MTDAMKAYNAAWRRICDSSDPDLFMARSEAYQWHGGQNSSLYSFASTDCTVWSEEHRAGLVAEIEDAIANVTADPTKYYPDWDSVVPEMREQRQSGTPESEWGNPADAGLESLENLLKAVKVLPVRPSTN